MNRFIVRQTLSGLMALAMMAGIGGTALGSQDGQVTAYPQNSDWWTGTSYEYGRQQNGELEWSGPGGANLRPWVKFDLSEVPAGATVNGAVLYYNVLTGTGYPNAEIRQCITDPVPVPGYPNPVWQEIGESQVCGTGSGAAGWHSAVLNASGVAHVQNCLGQGWVALGFKSTQDNYTWSRACGHSSPDRPYLVVSYTTQSVAEPGNRPTLSGFVVRPSVVTNGWAELRTGSNWSGNVCAEIYDASGRGVREQSFHVGNSLPVLTLDCRSLPSGIYYLRLAAGGRTVSRRFLVQH